MKAVFTLIAVVIFTISGFAQETETTTVDENKVETVEVKEAKENQEVARLYMYKNSRIKKALGFRTKKSKAKLA